MAITKRIIILEQLNAAPITYRYLMWADVPAARQPFYAAKQTSMVSAWKDAAAADNTALQNGSVTERVDIATMAPGDTIAAGEARLQAVWTAFQAEINAANPWVHYGTFMDTSSAWNPVSVA